MPAKKKVKPGIIEPDKDALALNVHYTEEVTDEDGETTKTMKVKQVRLGNLDPSADIAAMASQVVADCKYIPSKNLGLVEQALLSLQSRVLTAHGRSSSSIGNGGGAAGGGGGRGAFGMGGISSGEVLADPRDGRDRGGGGGGAVERLPPASMSSIDEYLELMYEENVETKVKTSTASLKYSPNYTKHRALGTLIQGIKMCTSISLLCIAVHKDVPCTRGREKGTCDMTAYTRACFILFLPHICVYIGSRHGHGAAVVLLGGQPRGTGAKRVPHELAVALAGVRAQEQPRNDLQHRALLPGLFVLPG